MRESGKVSVVLGLQRGDEGKGRIVDDLAGTHDIVARYNGGPNAGHTIVDGDTEVGLHQIPCGISYADTQNILGNGVLLDPPKLLEEIDELEQIGIAVNSKNLVISNLAHLILPHYISLDQIREAGGDAQGSTQSGIAFAASTKYERVGLRAEDIENESLLYRITLEGLIKANRQRRVLGFQLHNPKQEAETWVEQAQKIVPYLGDTVKLLNKGLDDGATALAEGAQGFGLDIEHGMYPYVTSSHTGIGGVINGLGISHHRLGRVVGVIKAVKSHVGGGPFVTKIADEALADAIRGNEGDVDGEYGTTTGRPRDVGYLDLPELRRAIKLNGVTELALTKLDHLNRYGLTIPVALEYQHGKDRLTEAPSSARELEACQPVYTEVRLWGDKDVSDAKNMSDLPAKAQDFVRFLEKQLGLPINLIGVGPSREQLIVRKKRKSY